jgi:hypothetical protein
LERKGGLYFLIAIILVMIGILIVSSGFRFMKAKLLPMTVAGVILTLSVIELVKDIRLNKISSVSKKPEGVQKSHIFPHRYLLEGAWIVGFFLTLYLVGFLVAIGLFILFYLKWHRRRWRTAILMAIVVTGLIHGIFTYLMGVSLYPGLISEPLGLR